MSPVDRARRRREYLLATGRPSLVSGDEVERLQSRIRSMKARGMTYAQMERQTGVSFKAIWGVANRPDSRARRSTLTALAGLHFEEPDFTAPVQVTGSFRRLNALSLAGYQLRFLAERLPFAGTKCLQDIMLGVNTKKIQYGRAKAIADLYEELMTKSPADYGISSRSVLVSATYARRRGAVPASCWDPDTIDDPDAIPQWTGMCGTPYGARIHRREGIPVCGPCSEADGGQKVAGFSGERFRELRLKKGLSLNAMVEACGFKYPHVIISWEAGRTIPTRGELIDRALSVLDATFEDVTEEVPE